MWSSPCEYLKLREDVYCMCWVEHKWEGLMDALFRNLRTGRDCSFVFGISHGGESIFMDKGGCKTRHCGKVDLSGLYPLRNYNVMA